MIPHLCFFITFKSLFLLVYLDLKNKNILFYFISFFVWEVKNYYIIKKGGGFCLDITYSSCKNKELTVNRKKFK